MTKRRSKKASDHGKRLRRLPKNPPGRPDEAASDPEYDQLVEKARNANPADLIPIQDPCEEKKVFENHGINGYAKYLLKGQPKGVVFPGGLEGRLSAVYRRCYEISNSFDVIADFVAFLPSLAFTTTWLAELVKDQTAFMDTEPGSERYRLLMALGRGFRRAAHPLPRIGKLHRANKLLAARDLLPNFQRKFRGELKFESADWKYATEEEKDHRVADLVASLVKTYPVLRTESERLKTHLKARRFRKAAVIVVSKILRVLAHKLESKLPV